MALFTKKSTPRTKVIFDIADDSVAAAIYTETKDRPDIVWSKRRPVSFSRHLQPDHFKRAMLSAVEQLHEDLRADGLPLARRQGLHPDIEHVRCVFSPVWQVSDTVKSGFQQREPFSPTKEHIHRVGRDAHRRFDEKHDSASKKRLSHLSHWILSASGDGKPLSAISKRPIQRLDLTMHISKIPKDTKTAVSKILTQLFQINAITFHSGSKLMHQAMASSFHDPAEFIIVAPGRKRTEVSLSSKGVMSRTSSAEIGEDFLVRTIAAALNRTYGEVRSRLSLHHKGKHHASINREISIALREIGKRWAKAVSDQIHQVSNGSPPQHVYILLPTGYTRDSFTDFVDLITEEFPRLRLHTVDDFLFRDLFHNSRRVDHRIALGILGIDQY